MDLDLKKALDRVKAEDALKQKTTDYIRSLDSNVISIRTVHGARRWQPNVKRLVAAACAAIVLCALPIGGYAVYQAPTSYVSVDINPSVELGINTFGKVVRVTPYNTDGETVVSGLSLLNRDVESAVRLIVKSAAQNGFIKDDGSSYVSVTTETNSNTAAGKLEDAAKTGAENAIASEEDTATVEAEHIGLDRRDDAIQYGISPGKLNLIEKLQAFDPNITVDEYKNATVSEIQKKFVELKKEHNGKDKEDSEETSSPSPDASSSASPTSSPDASVSGDVKPNGNGNHNGNDKDDDASSSPSQYAENDQDEDSAGSTQSEHNNNGNNGDHGSPDKDSGDQKD